jgi:UDP-2,3-diacylglucosamine pyrophosphatase LpxH
MSHLIELQFYQEYVWHYAGLRHLAIHGHQFDRLVANNMRLNYLGTLLYLQLEKLDLKGKPVARFFDRLNTRWLRMSSKVASGALFHARLRKADRIFCGHTHVAMEQEKDGIHYYNAGGWVDERLTYITVDPAGVRVHEYKERPDHPDSGEEPGDDSALAELNGESGRPEDAEYENIRG